MCLMYLSWNKLMHDFNHRAFVFITWQEYQSRRQEVPSSIQTGVIFVADFFESLVNL